MSEKTLKLNVSIVAYTDTQRNRPKGLGQDVGVFSKFKVIQAGKHAILQHGACVLIIVPTLNVCTLWK